MREGVEHPVGDEGGGVVVLEEMRAAAGVGDHALHDVVGGHDVAQVAFAGVKEGEGPGGFVSQHRGQDLVAPGGVLGQDGDHGEVAPGGQGQRMDGDGPEAKAAPYDHARR